MTKKASKVLNTLYGIYKALLKHNVPRAYARRLCSFSKIHQKYFSDMHVETLKDLFTELKSAGFLEFETNNGNIEKLRLTHKAIVFQETKYEESLNKAFDLIKLLKVFF